jgi:hypothetical protein
VAPIGLLPYSSKKKGGRGGLRGKKRSGPPDITGKGKSLSSSKYFILNFY